MTGIERPYRPVDLNAAGLASFDLADLVGQLVQERQYQDEGKAGITLARDPHLTVVLEALRRGSELREHRAPAPATVMLISGRASFVSAAGGVRTEMLPGTLVAFACELDHSLVAAEDSACLIVIGGR